MGRAGPPPKPTALRILHGEESYRINKDEPKPNPGVPDPPATITDAARAIWDYIVPELATMGLITRPDRDQIHAYCEAAATHAYACQMMQSPEAMLLFDKDLARLQRESSRSMLSFAREFGLTPSSRVQFKAQEIAESTAARLLS